MPRNLVVPVFKWLTRATAMQEMKLKQEKREQRRRPYMALGYASGRIATRKGMNYDYLWYSMIKSLWNAKMIELKSFWASFLWFSTELHVLMRTVS